MLKAHRGTRIDWVDAQLEVNLDKSVVTASLPKKKAEELKELVKRARRAPTAARSELRTLAGKAS